MRNGFRYIASDPGFADRREDFPADDWQDDPDDWSPLAAHRAWMAGTEEVEEDSR